RIASRFLDLPADLADILNDLLSKRGKAALFSDMATESRRLLGGPHPRIAAATSVDVYPFKSAPPIIAGLPYHPRPIVQSYQAYTRVLAQHDVDHIRRNGAEIYVVHVGSIDNRPTFADGGYLWPEFLSLYDPVDQVPLGLVLERRSIPVTLDSRTVFEGTSAYNTRIDLPATAPGTILQVQGTIRPTILGRVFGLVFKPPQLTLTLRRADGGEQVHRLVPGQLGAGFPISPILHDPEEVQALFDGRQAGSAVTEFRINAAGFQRLFWANGFPLTVTQIHRPGQD
ncbi:MAG: hypothetical protein P1U88_19665, partial [Thalassobaculaceae bacterium]|nr:hypothetical protein [Thalassobaculaceae bacterium]